jgi:hypothetical protein
VAVGTLYGLAKEANVISMKIWDDRNYGRASHVYSAIEWIAKTAPETGRSSIVNLGFTMDPDRALNSAVSVAIEAGVHFVGAAGDETRAAHRFPAGSESCLGSVNVQDLTLH